MLKDVSANQERIDKVTIDFQTGQITWETPEKSEERVCESIETIKPVILDILGEGEQSAGELAGFLDILTKDAALRKAFTDAREVYKDGAPDDEENMFCGSQETKRIEATVLKESADSLAQMMVESGNTLGEVIDKLCLSFSHPDLDTAISFATEEILICLSELSPEDEQIARGRIASYLISTLSEDERTTVMKQASSLRDELVERIKAMEKEDLAELMNKYFEYQEKLKNRK